MKVNRFDLVSSHEVLLETMLRVGVRAEPDVSTLAGGTKDRLWIRLWHYHEDDLKGPMADISLTVDSLATTHNQANLAHYRIDENHSNAFSVWKGMGSPQEPSPEQYATLDEADTLTILEPDQTIKLNIQLPRQGVSLIELKLK